MVAGPLNRLAGRDLSKKEHMVSPGENDVAWAL
jgi:hypothetical protein